MTRRIEVLSEDSRALRADMNRSLVDIAGAVTSGQDQITRDVDGAVADPSTAYADLNARLQVDLGSLRATKH